MLRKLQRCLLQVANLGTSSSRKTFIAFRGVRPETQTGAHGRTRRYPSKPTKTDLKANIIMTLDRGFYAHAPTRQYAKPF